MFIYFSVFPVTTLDFYTAVYLAITQIIWKTFIINYGKKHDKKTGETLQTMS